MSNNFLSVLVLCRDDTILITQSPGEDKKKSLK